MVSATDIITYISVPLAIIGVAPIFYTYLKTMIMSFRLCRTLKIYDIEASSPIRNHRSESSNLSTHVTTRGSARTNPDGFWDLSQKGLNVIPGTCLVKEMGEDEVEKPILVVAKPTIEHPGMLLLRFQNTPSKTRRTHQDLGPEWIKVPTVPAPPESTEEAAVDEVEVSEPQAAQEVSETTQQQLSDAEQAHTEPENVVYVCLNRQGLLEKKYDTGVTLPITGIASTMGGPLDIHLSKRFELSIYAKMRNHAAGLRRSRYILFQAAHELEPGKTQSYPEQYNNGDSCIPFEVFSIPNAIWSRAARECIGAIAPLRAHHVPTAQEVCFAAITNVDFATEVVKTIEMFYNPFKEESKMPSFEKWNGPRFDLRYRENFNLVLLLCAFIVIQSTADEAPYLAALGDVQACVTKWDPVYLC